MSSPLQLASLVQVRGPTEHLPMADPLVTLLACPRRHGDGLSPSTKPTNPIHADDSRHLTKEYTS